MSTIKLALSNLMERYQDENPLLLQPYDPEWRSPCEQGSPFTDSSGQQVISWAPTVRSPSNDFTGLENALETSIHADIKEYFSGFWSGPVETSSSEGHVSLILLWNQEDIDRLVENLIGHSLAQKRSQSALSIFFACTEPDSELFITVRNSDGVVQLEKPGHKPVREIEDSLLTFLGRLTPVAAVT
ncbi:MAG: SecY-interacting protein Syd [Pseudomonadales bacterium]|nr:SecY-interacting protein Syd [Pseudomonadales bacterium]